MHVLPHVPGIDGGGGEGGGGGGNDDESIQVQDRLLQYTSLLVAQEQEKPQNS